MIVCFKNCESSVGLILTKNFKTLQIDAEIRWTHYEYETNDF